MKLIVIVLSLLCSPAFCEMPSIVGRILYSDRDAMMRSYLLYKDTVGELLGGGFISGGFMPRNGKYVLAIQLHFKTTMMRDAVANLVRDDIIANEKFIERSAIYSYISNNDSPGKVPDKVESAVYLREAK